MVYNTLHVVIGAKDKVTTLGEITTKLVQSLTISLFAGNEFILLIYRVAQLKMAPTDVFACHF